MKRVTQGWLFRSKQLQKAVFPCFSFVIIIAGMFYIKWLGKQKLDFIEQGDKQMLNSWIENILPSRNAR